MLSICQDMEVWLQTGHDSERCCALGWLHYCALLMLRAHPELNTIEHNPWRNSQLKQRGGCGNKDAFLLRFYRNLIVHIASPSHMWVDSRFHFLVRFMKGATTPFITMRLFQFLSLKTLCTVWCALTLGICWTCWMSLKTARMAVHSKGQWLPWVCEGAGVFVPGRSLKSNKPLSVCQARSHLRSLNNS